MIMVRWRGPRSITKQMFAFRTAQFRRLKRRNPELAAAKERDLAIVQALLAANEAFAGTVSSQDEWWSPW